MSTIRTPVHYLECPLGRVRVRIVEAAAECAVSLLSDVLHPPPDYAARAHGEVEAASKPQQACIKYCVPGSVSQPICWLLFSRFVQHGPSGARTKEG